MKRVFWVGFLVSGAAWAAYAQDTTNGVPPDTPAASEPGFAGQPEDRDPTDPESGPIDPITGRDESGVPIDPGSGGTADPGFETDEPGTLGAEPGFEAADPGFSDALPVDPDASGGAQPGTFDDPSVGSLLDPGSREDQPLSQEPLDGSDIAPADEALPPGTDVRDAQGQGAPLLDDDPLIEPTDPRVDDGGTVPPGLDRRLPIERQPLGDPELSEPLPAESDVAPGPGRRPVIDPAYGAPAPPRPRPQIEIEEVVRNPVRVYETRLLVLMGHQPAAEEAIGVLSKRFPTDARVPYLRYFHLSRTGQRDAALDTLRQAVAMERLYPVIDYNRFMEPLQGADRYYLERVRRATAELAAAGGLVEPNADEVVPDEARGVPTSDPNAPGAANPDADGTSGFDVEPGA